MGRIVAIGGGEIRQGETLLIDREIITMSGTDHPRLCFIPTASEDAPGYITAIEQHFGTELGCEVSALTLYKQPYSHTEMEDLILSSDILYVGGGNTRAMLHKWAHTGLDSLIRQAWDRDIILSGLSAGALCWFSLGCSDSETFDDPSAPLMMIEGLGLVDLTLCPHFDSEPGRRPGFQALLREHPQPGITLEDGTALRILDGQADILSHRPEGQAWLCSWMGPHYQETPVSPGSPISI